MGDKNEPTGGTTLATAAVNSEFSSQTNILANMEGDVKGREVLLNKDSPSGTLERDSMDIERKKSPGKKPNTETVDGFQRFDVQEVSELYIIVTFIVTIVCWHLRNVLSTYCMITLSNHWLNVFLHVCCLRSSQEN